MPSTNAKLIACGSYVTLLGWLIALIVHQTKGGSFSAFHIRQAAGLHLLGMAVVFVPLLGWILYVAVFLMLVVGFFLALTDNRKPLPLVGEPIQAIFAFID